MGLFIANSEWPLVDVATNAAKLPHPPNPPEQAHESNQKMEDFLAYGKRTPDKEVLPQESLRARFPTLAGRWERSLAGVTTLRLTRVGEDRYTVSLKTGGCFGYWQLNRAARYVNGVLVLDRPIIDYVSDDPYQHLYSLLVRGRNCLIPAGEVGRFQEDLATNHFPSPFALVQK